MEPNFDFNIEPNPRQIERERRKDTYERIFNYKKMPAIQESFHRGPVRPRNLLKTILYSIAAAGIDGLIIFSMGCLFTLSFVFLNKVSSFEFVLNLGWDVLLIFVGVFMLYMIMLRAYMKQTIGEWACGIYLGTFEQQNHPYYGLRVVDRTLILLMTGLIVLPLLSLVLRVDLLERFCKLALYHRADLNP